MKELIEKKKARLVELEKAQVELTNRLNQVEQSKNQLIANLNAVIGAVGEVRRDLAELEPQSNIVPFGGEAQPVL